MRKRTQGRECALKILYAIDITKEPAEKCANDFWLNQDPVKPEVRHFADALVDGTLANKAEVDRAITKNDQLGDGKDGGHRQEHPPQIGRAHV